MNVDLGYPSPVLCDGARGRGFFLPYTLELLADLSTLGNPNIESWLYFSSASDLVAAIL
jgi:hypothetical protein